MRVLWAAVGLGFLSLWLPVSSVLAQLEVSPPSDLPVVILPKTTAEVNQPGAAKVPSPTAPTPRSRSELRPQLAAKPNKAVPTVAPPGKKPKTSRPLTLVKADRPGQVKGNPRLLDAKKSKTAGRKTTGKPRP